MLLGFFVLFFVFSGLAGNNIYLKGGKLNPSEMESSPSSFGAQSTGNDYNILQFKESSDKSYREKLERDYNIDFVSYIPEDAWIVSAKQNRGKLISEDKVRFVGPYRSSYKLSPGLRKELKHSSDDVKARVEVFKDSENIRSLLDKYGTVLGKYGRQTWRVEASQDQLNDLAAESKIQFISQKSPEPQTFNYESRDLIGVNTVQSSPYNLKGDGFTAGIWDGGWAGEHPDLNYTDSKLEIGDKGENCGNNCSVIRHATHVAGTMLGAGIEDYSYRGIAPNSSLVTYEWPAGNGTELYQETEESITEYNATISQNSWGYGIGSSNKERMGNYETIAPGYDAIISGVTTQVSERIPIVFAAGNNGERFGFRYNTTAGPGATAKNTITVGAVDSSGDMNSFSSWGPTDDGRIKPTLVSDGGDNNEFVFSTFPQDDYTDPYGGLAGTSMAAPAVAGSAILLNQRYNQSYGELPKPSTVKATLIHTVEDINRTGPDYITGWGLVNATSAIDYIEESDNKNLIKTGSLSNGETDSYSVEVPKNEEVKFTLVWDDYPASTSVTKTLVNDLDLVVENGVSERKYPWTLSWENRTQEALKTQEDHTNPVEQVHVADTQTNQYNIEVQGYNVPEGPQDYSLLMTSKEADNTTPNITTESPSNTTYSEIPDFNLSSNESLSQAVFSIDGKGNYSMKERDSKYFYNTSADINDGSHTTTLWGEDDGGNWASDDVEFTLDTQEPNLSPKTPEDQANISGDFKINASWSDSTTEVEEANYTISNSTYTQSGQLNASINSVNLADGSYTIYYNVTDSAGNERVENRSVTIDNSAPNIDIDNPSEGSNLSGSFEVNTTFKDDISGIDTQNISLKNTSGTQETFTGNKTIDTETYSDGDYTLNFEANDSAGNTREKSINIVFDNTTPNIEPISPIENQNITDSFQIEAEWNDSTTAVEKANYTIANSTYQESGALNSTVDSNNLADGDYTVYFNATDSAGNAAESNISVKFDNSPPELQSSSIQSGENISGIFDVNASFKDVSSLDMTQVRFLNQSGSVTNWQNLNYTDFNSSNLSDGDYNLSIQAKDSTGNSKSFTLENLTVDNENPSISLTEYNESAEYNGWINNSKKVEATCSDAGTGIKTIESDYRSSSTSPVNFTLAETGDLDFNFTCSDYAGNEDSKNLSFKIDNQKPSLDSLSPTNNSDTDRNFELVGSFNDESQESGFNQSASSLNISKGAIQVGWNENLFNASISELDYSQSYTIEGKLEDNLGHIYTFTANYDTKEDSNSNEDTENSDNTDDSDSGSSSGGGGGGGGYSLPDSEDDNEQTEENQTNSTQTNETNNETDTSVQEVEEVVAANPEENSCQTFNESQLPDAWNEVENCQTWKEQRAQELVEQINSKEDEEIVSRAESALEQGDYDKAIELAASSQDASETESPRSNNLIIFVVAGLAAVLMSLTAFGIHLYRKKKLISNVNKISKEMIKLEEKGVSDASEESLSELDKAQSAIEDENYKSARSHLEKFKQLR